MNQALPENRPETQWLWPWPPQPTREFFSALGAQEDFKPGPGPDHSTLVFRILLSEETSDDRARQVLARQAGAWGFPPLKPEQLLAVRARPIRLNAVSPAFIEATVAVLPTNVALGYFNPAE